MATAENRPVCYLVSPLSYGNLPGQENSDAKAFAEQIIAPALKNVGFTLLTAAEGFRHFAGQQGNIGSAIGSSQEWLERADLVIIDMTQEATNSVFEAGYRNALKKPCIVYTAGSYATEGEIAGVRYIKRLSPKIPASDQITHLSEQIRQVMTNTPITESDLDEANFGFAPDSAPFGSGTFASSGGEVQQNTLNADNIPAAGRYVSVKDNQPAFDEVRKNISDIRNEFANDHNKRELPVENLDGIIAELDAFDLQIEKNWVSRPAAKNFLETLKYIETVCVSSAKILGAITAIIGSLTIIFGLM